MSSSSLPSPVVGQEVTLDLTENSQVPVIRARQSTRSAALGSPLRRRALDAQDATVAPAGAARRARFMERSPAGEIRSPYRQSLLEGNSAGDNTGGNPATSSAAASSRSRPGARAAALAGASSAATRRRIDRLAPTPLVLPGNPVASTSTGTSSSTAASTSRQRGIVRDDSDIQITEVRQG